MLIPAEDFIWWSGQVGSQVRIGPSSCIPVALSFLLNWRNCFGCFSFMNVSELVYFCSCIFVITQYLFSVVSHYGFFPCCIYILKDMSYLVVQPHNNVQWLIQMNCIFFPEQLSYAILLPKMFCVYWVFVFMDCIHGDSSLCVVYVFLHTVTYWLLHMWLKCDYTHRCESLCPQMLVEVTNFLWDTLLTFAICNNGKGCRIFTRLLFRNKLPT